MADNVWLSAVEPLIIAHRGASAHATENSLDACALAVDHAADGVEVDVQLTRDGRVVLMHDATLTRLTGSSRKVSELSLAELRDERLPDGQHIPLLEDLFETFGDLLLYNLELKDFGLRDRGLVDSVAEIVARYKLGEQILVSSFNPLQVRRAGHSFPRSVAVALLRAPGLLRYTRFFVHAAVDNPHSSLVDKAYAEWAATKGLRSFIWTIDDAEEARRVLSLGVNGLITNDPARLRAELALPA
ncbi:MAG: glycerophosphodiester phosphodiesterase [Candidatus Promineifilaceae bacterium]